MSKGKVSFDYDSTLDRKDVQRFAKKLIDAGYEVWIVTSRLSLEHAKANLDQWTINRVEKSNIKLFRVADNFFFDPLNFLLYHRSKNNIAYKSCIFS